MARILVAEDDVLLLGAIPDALELDGYRVDGVTNGVQAMEAFSHFQPELIIILTSRLQRRESVRWTCPRCQAYLAQSARRILTASPFSAAESPQR